MNKFKLNSWNLSNMFHKFPETHVSRFSQKSPDINQTRLINPEWNEVEISLQFTPEGQSKYVNLDTYIYIYIYIGLVTGLTLNPKCVFVFSVTLNSEP